MADATIGMSLRMDLHLPSLTTLASVILEHGRQRAQGSGVKR